MAIKAPARTVLTRILSRVDPTVAQGWDIWARRHKRHRSRHPLGDEWNEPTKIGLDVEANQVVDYLDRELFAPYLGECHTILEIGPGGGRFTRTLLPKCQELIAVEAAPTMIKLLRERFAGEPKIRYVLTRDATLTGVGDAAVDAVFSYDVFVHLQHWDIFRYLQEVARVLRPGGRAIIHHANTFSERGWTKFLSDLPISVGRHKLPATFSVMTPELMTEFARRAGLEPVRMVTDVVKRDCIALLRAPS